MSTRVSARAKSTAAPRSIDRCAARSDRPNPTASLSRRRPSTSGPYGARTMAGSVTTWVLGRSAGRAGLREIPPCAVAADLADVLLVLEDDPERLVDEVGCELAGTQ